MSIFRRKSSRARRNRVNPRAANRRAARVRWRGGLAAIRRRIAGVWTVTTWHLGRALPYVLVAVIMALVPLAVGYGYRYLTVAPSFAVQQVQVGGHSQVSAQEVLQTAGVDRSPNVLALDLSDIERRLVGHPWILTARVERRLPDRLAIAITERVPVAVVALGSLYLVDENAAVFKRVEAGEHWDYPVLTGLSPEDLADSSLPERRSATRRLIRGAIKVLDVWRASELGTKLRVSEIALDPLFGYTLVLGQGLDVAVGAMIHLGTGDLRDKLRKVQVVLGDAASRGRGVAEIRVNDERDPSRVAVRFRDEESAGGHAGDAPGGKVSNKDDRSSVGHGEAVRHGHLARRSER